jgi:glutaredoxin
LIILYTKSHCPKCDDIKRHLKEKGVEFSEKNSDDPEVMQQLILRVNDAGLKNPLFPICEFEDGSIVSNDMGLYKELKERGVL